MTTTRKTEVEAIRTLVNLHDPDTAPAEWQPEHWDQAEAAAMILTGLLRRHHNAEERAREARERRQRAPVTQRRKPDPPELTRAKSAVRQRARGCCEVGSEVCNGRHQHTHHRRLRSQGGGHAPENLLAVCWPCHDLIHANPERSYAEGWLVRSKADEEWGA